MPSTYDVIIVGGGVVGSMIARFLARYQLSILLIEKESDVGMGASSANSAIIHAGHDPLPGTLKASLNIRANPIWDQLAAELNVPFERRGSYVVASGPEEFAQLDALLQRSRQNGVPGVEIISRDEMLHREPFLSPNVSGALHTPTAGLIDTLLISLAAAENALQNGVTVLLETAFQDFIWKAAASSAFKPAAAISIAAGSSMPPGYSRMRSCTKPVCARNSKLPRAAANTASWTAPKLASTTSYSRCRARSARAFWCWPACTATPWSAPIHNP